AAWAGAFAMRCRAAAPGWCARVAGARWRDIASRGVLCGLLWALLLAGGTGIAAVPETPVFRALGTGQGLPSSVASAMLQDREGYLWIATDDGLARYDGVGFRVWQHDPADPASLPGNAVSAIHLDAEDGLWVATGGGGLSLLDRERRAFRHYAAHLD